VIKIPCNYIKLNWRSDAFLSANYCKPNTRYHLVIMWCDNAVAGALATSRPTTGLLPDKYGWTTLAAAAVSRTSGLAHTVAGVPTTAVMERTFQYRVLQPRLRLHQLMLYLVRTCCVRSDSVADRTNSFFTARPHYSL